MNRRRVIAASAGMLLPAIARSAESTLRSDELSLPTRDGRMTRVRVLASPGSTASAETRPLLVFSHGAASTNRAYDRVLTAWARAGYAVLAPDHLDAGRTPATSELSHDRLWTSRVLDLLAALDGRAAIDALALAQGWRADWSRVGAAGHSFGGLTAQALGGAKATPSVLDEPDPRVRAILSLSPPGIRKGFVAETAWVGVTAPLFVETGTSDFLPGFIDDWRMHLASFFEAGSRVRWAAVGRGVDHYFGGRICTLRDPPDPDQSRPFDALLQASTAFLDGYLGGQAGAAHRLEDDFRRQALQPAMTLYRA